MNFKKLILGTALSFLFIGNAYAQSESKSGTGINIHINPITMLVGVYSIGVDVAVNQKLTLGGSYQHIDFSSEDFDSNIDATASGFGLRMQYFLNEALQDGWYFSGFGDFGKGEVDSTTSNEYADIKVTSIGATAGYFWIWEHFNIQLGLGMQNSKIDVSDSTLSAQDRADVEDLEGVGLTGDFRIGLAF